MTRFALTPRADRNPYREVDVVVSDDVLCRAMVHDGGDGTVVVVVSGEVDMFSAPVLAEALDDAAAADPPQLVVDMTRLDFIDAAGLRVLMPLAAARGAHRPVVLRAPPPVILRVMGALGLDRPFVIEHAPRPEEG